MASGGSSFKIGRAGSEQQQERGADRGGGGGKLRVGSWELRVGSWKFFQILKCYHLWCSPLYGQVTTKMCHSEQFQHPASWVKNWHHISSRGQPLELSVNYPNCTWNSLTTCSQIDVWQMKVTSTTRSELPGGNHPWLMSFRLLKYYKFGHPVAYIG